MQGNIVPFPIPRQHCLAGLARRGHDVSAELNGAWSITWRFQRWQQAFLFHSHGATPSSLDGLVNGKSSKNKDDLGLPVLGNHHIIKDGRRSSVYSLKPKPPKANMDFFNLNHQASFQKGEARKLGQWNKDQKSPSSKHPVEPGHGGNPAKESRLILGEPTPTNSNKFQITWGNWTKKSLFNWDFLLFFGSIASFARLA